MGLAAAVVGAGALGAGASIIASQTASGAEQSAAQKATDAQLQMYNQTEANLSPYNTAGQAALNQLMYGLGLSSSAPGGATTAGAASAYTPTSQSSKSFAGYSEGGISAQQAASILQNRPDVMSSWNSLPAATQGYFGNDPNNYAAYWYNRYGQSSGYQIPSAGGSSSGSGGSSTPASSAGIGQNSLISNFQPTEAQLQQTPGYQFTAQQGLKSVQNAAAARGLGSSGAALKGASTYATGLADTTYQDQFQNYLTQQQANYQKLLGLSGLGESAASQTGNFATATGQSIGNNITGAGSAAAAADTASGNAVASAGNSVGNLYLTNALLQANGGWGIFGQQPAGWENGPPSSLYGS